MSSPHFSEEPAPATTPPFVRRSVRAGESAEIPAVSFVEPLVVSLLGATLLVLASRVPLFEIGDTAIVGRVYAWGVDGSWNNVAPALGRGYVNHLEIAQWIATALTALAVIAAPALRRRMFWMSGTMPIALILLAWVQARTLAPFGPNDVLLSPTACAYLLALSALLLVGHRRATTAG
jgi:hypothetical protein